MIIFKKKTILPYLLRLILLQQFQTFKNTLTNHTCYTQDGSRDTTLVVRKSIKFF